MSSLLSMEGRLNRAAYLGRVAAIAAVAMLASVVTGFLIGTTLGAGAEQTARIAGAIIGLACTVLTAFQAVRRLHDLDRPGIHYWLFLVPFYNFYLSILLLFARGTDGPNQYGEDPLSVPPAALPASV
jgi:uncharacterized membrane protein YhaH (DUF805 family)